MKHKHTFKRTDRESFKCTRCGYRWIGVLAILYRATLDPNVYINVVPHINPTRGGMSNRLELKKRMS